MHASDIVQDNKNANKGYKSHGMMSREFLQSSLQHVYSTPEIL